VVQKILGHYSLKFITEITTVNNHNHHRRHYHRHNHYNHLKNNNNKVLKYKDLTIEIQRMWNVKAKVTSVITGATGTISKCFRKYLSSVPGKHDIKELQKTARLGTAHTAGSANVVAQKGLILKTALYAPLTVRAE
jgi:2-phosphoglycerate kinase